MDKVRYGIIGCGGHALLAHALPGKNIPELELTTVYDIRPESAADFQRQFGEPLTMCDNIGQLLVSDIDAVLIASPDEFHIEHLGLAIEFQKNVLVEKPLAVNEEDLVKLNGLIDLAYARGLEISTCHPRRFDPPFLWLKSMAGELQQRLGDPVGFHFDFSYHKPQAAWKGTRSLLLDHLNHELDLMHFLCSPYPFQARMEYDSHNQYLVTGMRDDRIAFSFHGTRCLENKLYLEWLTIRFQRGEVKIDAHAGTADISDHESDTTERVNCGATDYSARSLGVMQNFVDAILCRAPSYLTADDLWVNNWMGVTLKKYGHAEYNLESMRG
jgi:predicted dehydrogenase